MVIVWTERKNIWIHNVVVSIGHLNSFFFRLRIMRVIPKWKIERKTTSQRGIKNCNKWKAIVRSLSPVLLLAHEPLARVRTVIVLCVAEPWRAWVCEWLSVSFTNNFICLCKLNRCLYETNICILRETEWSDSSSIRRPLTIVICVANFGFYFHLYYFVSFLRIVGLV